MARAAAFSDEILGGESDASLDNRKRGEFLEVAEDLGFCGWLSADHPNRVAQKCRLWQGSTPFDGELFRGLEGGEGVLRVRRYREPFSLVVPRVGCPAFLPFALRIGSARPPLTRGLTITHILGGRPLQEGS